MLRVLTYHRVADPEDTPDLDPALVSATPDAFRKQMEHVKRRYRPVTLQQVHEAFLEGRPLPDRAVHVTVDDAYRDFAEEAWPILRELGIPATVFVPTAYPDHPSRILWWDRLHRATLRGPGSEAWKRAVRAGREALAPLVPAGVETHRDVRTLLRRLPHDETERFVDSTCREIGLDDVELSYQMPTVLSWDELRRLKREGVSFGVHTRHHAALASLAVTRMRSEIRGSIEDLTRELGPGPWPIAYPYGIYNPTVARVAREEGCTLGFTCDDGLNEPGMTDPFLLRRTNITVRTSPSVFALRMLPWFAEVDRWRHRHERVQALS